MNQKNKLCQLNYTVQLLFPVSLMLFEYPLYKAHTPVVLDSYPSQESYRNQLQEPS